jgi:hypothetical protein
VLKVITFNTGDLNRMKGKLVTRRLTHTRLLEALDYRPSEGIFYWKIDVPKNVRAGDIAGVRYKDKPNKRGFILIDGESIRMSQLAWFYMTKSWPEFRVKHINGDPHDFRFENLTLQSGIPGTFNHKTREDRLAYSRARAKILEPKRSETFGRLFEEQGGVCKICGNPETHRRNGRIKAIAIDHCHKTGVIRGLLCSDCNTGIGKLKDDPKILRQAAEYLENQPGSQALSTGPADAAETIGRNLLQEER